VEAQDDATDEKPGGLPLMSQYHLNQTSHIKLLITTIGYKYSLVTCAIPTNTSTNTNTSTSTTPLYLIPYYYK